MSETRKILEMVHAQQVSVDEALDLLAALEAHQQAPAPKGVARMIRLLVEAEDEARVTVNVPAPLAKFALQFVPKDARASLQDQGIDFAELLDALKGDLPEGRLVDIEAFDEEKGRQVKVIIDVS